MADHLADSAAIERLRKWVIRIPTSLIILITLLQLLNLSIRHRDAINATRSRAAELSRLLAEDMRGSIIAVDGSLKQIALLNNNLGGPNASTADWQPVLQTAIAGLSFVGSITITDTNGVIRQSTIPDLVGQPRGDHFLFEQLSSNPDAGLIADTPFISPRNNQIIIPLGRRLTAKDGSFQGIAVATFIPGTFRDFYKTIDIGQDGVIWIVHSTGLVLFRQPQQGEAVKNTTAPFFSEISKSDSGILAASLETGGADYITAWDSLGQPQMKMVVSLGLQTPIGLWRRNASIVIFVSGLIITVLAGAAWQLSRQLDARITAERALLHRDEELIEAQRIAGIGSARFSLPEMIAQVSSQFCSLLGLNTVKSEITLDGVISALAENDRPRLRAAIESCIKSGERYQIEVKTKQERGREKILLAEGGLTEATTEQGASILAIFQDVTEHRLAEQRSSQSERLAAVGRFTGGVAHDFNNLLTAIIGYSEILRSRFSEDEPARAEVEEIVKAGQRAADLTRQLLAFSRKQVLQPKILDLNSIIGDIEKMLQRLIGEDIQLITKMAQPLGMVKADPGQIEQVLMNLAVNARDAMPEGGKLIIETASIELDENYAQTHANVQPGQYVMLAVSDTGGGMDKDTLAHIFEPFFTTKEQGKGTGLGLATVYGIVRQSGGHIWVYSELGRGTTFKIHLPCTDERARTVESSASVGKQFEQSVTVLLVEDEESVRKLAQRILEINGIVVLEAGSAEEALNLYQQHNGQIDLLITDVIMPGSSGRELSDRLRAQTSDLKVLFMSGYTDDAIVHLGILEAKVPFVQKPFTPDTLINKVAEVLGKTGS